MRFSCLTIFIVVFGLMLMPGYAGFLQPASFPKTIDDISFTDRLALKQDAYEQFESQYDADGNCISGCAYALPKWEDELAAMERYNRLSRQELVTQHGYTTNSDGTLTPPPAAPVTSSASTTSNTGFPSHSQLQQTLPTSQSSTVANTNCAEINSGFGNRDIPYGNPLGRIICISSPY